MASFNMTGLEEFSEALGRLNDEIEEVAKQAVNEAAPKLEASMRGNIAAAANRGYATGSLAGAVKAGRAKVNNYGVYAAVTIKGTDGKGVRNGEKGAYLEYGTGKQDAHPFMAKSVKGSEAAVQEILERAVEDAAAKLF